MDDRYQTITATGDTHGYTHGYVNQRAFRSAPDGARWRTVMSLRYAM